MKLSIGKEAKEASKKSCNALLRKFLDTQNEIIEPIPPRGGGGAKRRKPEWRPIWSKLVETVDRRRRMSRLRATDKVLRSANRDTHRSNSLLKQSIPCHPELVSGSIKRHLMSLFNFLFLCLGINAYFIFFFLSHTPIKKEKKGSKKRKKNGLALFHNSRWCTKFKYSLSGNSLTLKQTLQRTLSLSAHGNSVSCHAEFISASIKQKIPKQVRNDNIVQNPQVQHDIIFSKRKCFAFSLIEVMLGLIVVSVMVAAFAPVITKKVSYAGVSLLNAAAGARIEDKVFTYQEAKDNIDGCKLSDDKLSLECPFVIPAVDTINVVMVSPGGGGAGATTSTITNKPINAQGTKSYIKITKNMKDFKIYNLLSAGGGGGGGYYKYVEAQQPTITPTSQSACDKAYTDTTYVPSTDSCTTNKNIPPTGISEINFVPDSASSVDIRKLFNLPYCWKVGSDYYCNRPAAEKICENYSNINLPSKGSWTLPNIKDVGVNSSKTNPCSIVADKYHNTSCYNGCVRYKCGTKPSRCRNSSGICVSRSDCPYDSASTLFTSGCKFSGTAIEWHGDYYDNYCNSENTSSMGNSCDLYSAYNVKSNRCGVKLFWVNGKTSTTPDYYGYGYSQAPSGVGCSDSKYGDFKLNGYKECYEYKKYCCSGSCGGIDFVTYYNSHHGRMFGPPALSVRCSIRKVFQPPIAEEQYTSSGAGGGAGAELTNLKIPDKVLMDNIGNYIVYSAGVGGTYGSSSGNGGSASKGSDGAKSFIYIKTNTSYDDTGIKWGIEVLPGKGGNQGAKNTTAQGGARAYQFRYYNGSGWITYSDTLPDSLKTNTSTKEIFEEAIFKLGAKGSNGSYGTGYKSAGSGGSTPDSTLSTSYNGKGGSGGSADKTTSSSGSSGTKGYVKFEYNDILPGAPGGGGGGGSMVKIESIPVVADEVMYITVGKGGKGGAVDSNGATGGVTSIKYNSTVYSLSSGTGGKVGTKATTTLDPVVGEVGLTPAIPNVPSAFAPNDTFVLKAAGTKGEKGAKLTDYFLSSKGGMGGLSGINSYLHGEPNNVDFSKLSVPCGGLVEDETTRCSLKDMVDASYTGSIFSYPSKLYKGKTTGWGSAGSGGGGGGVLTHPSQSGTGADGQNGYVYIWWSENDE